MSQTTCPQCGKKGRKVHAVTPRSLLSQQASARLVNESQARFCKSADCPVVYFTDDGQTFATDEVSVPVFQKASEPDRLVCYCFDYTVAGIAKEVRDTGSSDIPGDITEKCRQGLDRCEQMNPQGSCCLGNVREIVKAAQRGDEVETEAVLLACDACSAPSPKE